MFKCEKCGEDVRSRTDGICQKCQIGNKNPAHWALEKVKQSLLQGRGKEKYSKFLTGHEGVRYHLDGRYMNDVHYPHEQQKNMVSISCSGQCDNEDGFPNLQIAFHRWTHNGMVAFRKAGPFKISSIDTFVEEALPHFHESLVELINFAKGGNFLCSGCDKTFPKGTQAGRHFAGEYCSPCWEAFKKKNSRVCRKCRRPLYECYC